MPMLVVCGPQSLVPGIRAVILKFEHVSEKHEEDVKTNCWASPPQFELASLVGVGPENLHF